MRKAEKQNKFKKFCTHLKVSFIWFDVQHLSKHKAINGQNCLVEAVRAL